MYMIKCIFIILPVLYLFIKESIEGRSFIEGKIFKDKLRDHYILGSSSYRTVFLELVPGILLNSIKVYLWLVVLRAYQYLCILKEVGRRLNALSNI